MVKSSEQQPKDIIVPVDPTILKHLTEKQYWAVIKLQSFEGIQFDVTTQTVIFPNGRKIKPKSKE